MKRPYIIQKLSLVTYDGRIIPLKIFEPEIIDKPIRLVKEKVLNAFATMVDKPVDVKMKVRYI